MLGRQAGPFLLVLAALVSIAPNMSLIEAQSFGLHAAPSPLASPPTPCPSPLPSPSATLSEQARIRTLESQVAELKAETNLSRWKDVATIMQAVATVAALVIGGIWSYWLFVKNRQKYPRAGLAHHITHRYIGGNKLLLHVNVTISNAGDVLLSLVSLETRIQQVLPLADEVLDAVKKGRKPVPKGKTEALWPLIDSQTLKLKPGECELEPGETQEIHHDFVLDAVVQTVEAYTHVINEQKRAREIGWETTTVYDLDEKERASSHRRKGKIDDRTATQKTETTET